MKEIQHYMLHTTMLSPLHNMLIRPKINVAEHESDFETWENETTGTTCLKQDRVHRGFSYDGYMSQDLDNENTADENTSKDQTSVCIGFDSCCLDGPISAPLLLPSSFVIYLFFVSMHDLTTLTQRVAKNQCTILSFLLLQFK